VSPKQLLRRLEEVLGDREGWDSGTLRALWPEVAEGMTRRSRGIEHELAWLYLAGFVLRPGYGFAFDDSRMEELWRLFTLGMAFPGEQRVRDQWYLLWRRTAGGLSGARQEAVIAPVLPRLRAGGELSAEALYLVGALERLRLDLKVELTGLLTAGLKREKTRHKEPWARALGRVLSRVPLHAGPDAVLPPGEVKKAFERLRAFPWKEPVYAPLAPLFALAARRTEVRDIDIDPELRAAILGKMTEAGVSPELLRVVRDTVPVDHADQVRQFGESLPGGLILVRDKG
jgi:hypothetical protein